MGCLVVTGTTGRTSCGTPERLRPSIHYPLYATAYSAARSTSNLPPLCSDYARFVATSSIQWYTSMTAVCILRGRDRLCLLGRPWIEIEATSPPLGCTGYFVNPIFWGLMVHAVLVYVRAPTVCTDSDFRRFSADVLFPSIVADPWFAVPSSI